jgi:hypothetical protein
VLAAVNDKPFGRPQEGPSLTAAARAGQTCLRSGRKNACGAVEQKNGVKREDHKALAFQAAIRERRNGLRSNKETELKTRADPTTRDLIKHRAGASAASKPARGSQTHSGK